MGQPDILRELKKSNKPLTIPEISKRTNINKSNLYGAIKKLRERNEISYFHFPHKPMNKIKYLYFLK